MMYKNLLHLIIVMNNSKNKLITKINWNKQIIIIKIIILMIKIIVHN